MLDAFVAAEGEPEVVMFSGGEPTIHPRDPRDRWPRRERADPPGEAQHQRHPAGPRPALRPGAGRARRPHLPAVRRLRRGTHLAIRGRDLREDKQRALDNCAEAGLTVTLVAAVERGLNEHELGAIVRFGLAHPAVTGVVFQPVTHSGPPTSSSTRSTRLTNSDVIDAIGEQLPEWFRDADFFPVPCCFPTCRSVTYALDDGEDRGADPAAARCRGLPRLRRQPGRARLRGPRGAGEAVVGDRRPAAAPPGGRAARVRCLRDAGSTCPSCARSPRAAFMIVIQDFQDPYTLNVKQLMKCCVEEITPDGRLIPFCAYNSVGYREQVRAEMSQPERPRYARVGR